MLCTVGCTILAPSLRRRLPGSNTTHLCRSSLAAREAFDICCACMNAPGCTTAPDNARRRVHSFPESLPESSGMDDGSLGSSQMPHRVRKQKSIPGKGPHPPYPPFQFRRPTYGTAEQAPPAPDWSDATPVTNIRPGFGIRHKAAGKGGRVPW